MLISKHADNKICWSNHLKNKICLPKHGKNINCTLTTSRQIKKILKLQSAQINFNIWILGHSMSNHQYFFFLPSISKLADFWYECSMTCLWSLPSRLGQFRMILEICPIEFSLIWGFHGICQPLATPIAKCLYVCNYLSWTPLDMEIAKSVVFEVENHKMKVKTLKG